MEKRQLDLNAPLLSARRYSSPSKSPQLVKPKVIEKRLPSRQQSLPTNRSGWESEVVTRPVCVPFHWEQSRGRPKGDVESTDQTPEASITPRLPPGKLSDAFRRYSGEVPRPPLATMTRFSSGERMYDQSIYRPQVEAFSFNDHASLLESLSESLKCKDETDSESECDTYSDALDTLLPEESGSMDYSVSGISGCNSSDVKPSGTFCIDTDTRDFMMSRFLRAAKAVVVATPEYAVKKPSVAAEQPKPLKKSVSGPVEPSWKYNGSITLLPAAHASLDRDGAKNQDDQEHRVAAKKTGKFSWGVLRLSCVKNALCLLSPLPGMISKSRTPSTPPTVVDGSRFTRKAQSGPLDKSGCPVPPPPKKKFYSGLLSGDTLATENRLTNYPNHFLDSRDPYRSSGVSPLRRYRSGNVSPYRNEIPKSPFREGAVFLGVPKEVENSTANKIASSRKLFKALQDVSRNPTYERGSAPTGDIVEKTVYIDKSSYRKSGATDNSGENMKVAAGSDRIEDDSIIRFDQTLPCLNTSNEGGKQSPKFSFTDKDQDAVYALDVKPSQSPDSRTSGCIKQISDVVHKDGKSESVGIVEYDSLMKSPLPPPLPKSPSESWLWKTLPLPSINLGNPFAQSRQRGHLQSKKQLHKVTAADAKWETIVKTTNLSHHGPYSQALIPRSSHRQRKSILH